MPRNRNFRGRRWSRALAGAVAAIILLVTAPVASADLLKEAAATVETITSSLPKSTPPSDPPVSIPAPTPPPVQVQIPPPPTVSIPKLPPPPVKLPVGDSTSSGVPSSHSGGEVADGVKEVVNSAASATAEAGAEADALPDALNKGPDASGANGGRGGGHATSPATGAPSVGSGRETAVRRLTAYVWPAVALGPFGDLMRGLQATLDSATLPRISTLTIPDLVSGLTAGAITGDSEHSAATGSSPTDTPAISLPGSEDFPLLRLLVSVLAFMGLLAVAMRLELGAPYRWWPR
jgi:hypothetical protein